MTFSTSSDSGSPRSPTDSPSLWILVAAGSLVIHGAAFLGLRSLPLKEAATPPDSTPIAVELVPSIPDSGSVAPPTAASAQSPSTQTDPAPTASAPTAPAQTSLPKAENFKTRTAVMKSPKPTTPETTPVPAPTKPTPSKKPRLAAKPVADKASPSPVPSSESPTTSNRQLPGLPKVPNPAPADVGKDSSSLGSLEVSRNSVPARFLVAIAIAPPVVDRSSNDQPVSFRSNLPTALELSRTFISDPSGCLLTPEASHYFGQSVLFKVLPDAKGTLQADRAVEMQESSGSDRYDELAACALKTWTFKPASSDAGSAKAAMFSWFNVRVTIRQP